MVAHSKKYTQSTQISTNDVVHGCFPMVWWYSFISENLRNLHVSAILEHNWRNCIAAHPSLGWLACKVSRGFSGREQRPCRDQRIGYEICGTGSNINWLKNCIVGRFSPWSWPYFDTEYNLETLHLEFIISRMKTDASKVLCLNKFQKRS